MLTMRAMKVYPSAQRLGLFDVELRGPGLEAKGGPSSRLTEGLKPSRPKTERATSTQLRKVVLGGSQPLEVSP